jgi:penicillin-binding protein 2
MMQVREHRDELVRRVKLLAGLSIFVLVLIAVSFWSVQVVHGDYYRGLAENNRLRKLPVRAPRGLIYDREGRLMVENIPSYDLLIDRSRALDLDDSVRFASRILDRPEEELRAALETARNQPAFKPALVAADLTLAQVGRFEAKSLEHPEFEVDVRHLRLYRHGPRVSHILGYLGEVSQAEIDSAEGAYQPGELVGKKGVEKTYDLYLRGTDGERVAVVDSRGRVLEEYRRERAEPGKPLTLSLDLELQQEAARLMEDKVGAVVALDPRTGEIRALYSAPSYNSNLLARGVTQSQWQEIVEAPHHPLQNRATQNTYSPGSVFKAVMGAAALAEGVVTEHTRFHCGGATVIYNHRFRCWKQAGHGSVDLNAAIKGSCDIYFYNVGKALGIDRIARYSRMFGLGARTGIELDGEKAGLVPDPSWSLEVRKHPWYPGETISVSIGQGPILTTPLQIASMFAMIANDGRAVVPHLKAGETMEAEGGLDLPQGALQPVRHGLWSVVNGPGGTAGRSRLRSDEIEMAGKTGTVQVVAQSTWKMGESLPFELRDHAWFASFAPTENAELVVVVFVEHGGSGSGTAAPIAKAIHEKYFQLAPDDTQPRS